MKAQDLKPGHVLIEHGHEFTVTEVETMARAITLDQLHAEAAARYGPRQAGWAYQCPACGDVATGADVMWDLSQEPAACAQGRRLTAAQVLARWCLRCGATADEYGTTTVTLPDGEQVHVFELASKETP